MANKKVTYVEPASYFNASMRKAAKEWDKKHAAEEKKKNNSKSTTKK